MSISQLNCPGCGGDVQVELGGRQRIGCVGVTDSFGRSFR